MAKNILFATYDTESEQYNGNTFKAINLKIAKRILNDAMADDKGLSRNADKIKLYQLGYYDVDNGEIIADKKDLGTITEFTTQE